MIKIEELIVKAKQGNNEAMSKLILSVKDDLNRMAVSRLHNIEDANDVIQNTLIKSYLKINQLENTESFKSWIIKIIKPL